MQPGELPEQDEARAAGRGSGELLVCARSATNTAGQQALTDGSRQAGHEPGLPPSASVGKGLQLLIPALLPLPGLPVAARGGPDGWHGPALLRSSANEAAEIPANEIRGHRTCPCTLGTQAFSLYPGDTGFWPFPLFPVGLGALPGALALPQLRERRVKPSSVSSPQPSWPHHHWKRHFHAPFQPLPPNLTGKKSPPQSSCWDPTTTGAVGTLGLFSWSCSLWTLNPYTEEKYFVVVF